MLGPGNVQVTLQATLYNSWPHNLTAGTRVQSLGYYFSINTCIKHNDGAVACQTSV